MAGEIVQQLDCMHCALGWAPRGKATCTDVWCSLLYV